MSPWCTACSRQLWLAEQSLDKHGMGVSQCAPHCSHPGGGTGGQQSIRQSYLSMPWAKISLQGQPGANKEQAKRVPLLTGTALVRLPDHQWAHLGLGGQVTWGTSRASVGILLHAISVQGKCKQWHLPAPLIWELQQFPSHLICALFFKLASFTYRLAAFCYAFSPVPRAGESVHGSHSDNPSLPQVMGLGMRFPRYWVCLSYFYMAFLFLVVQKVFPSPLVFPQEELLCI